MEGTQPVQVEAEVLRLVLPLLIKYQIPPNPINYAIFYEYVTENKPGLRQEVVSALQAHGERFPAEEAVRLFKKYIAYYNEEHLLKVRDEIQAISAALIKQIMGLSGETLNHEAVLNRFVTTLDGTDFSDIVHIKTQVVGLIEGAQKMEAADKLFHSHMQAAQAEIDNLHLEIQRIRQEAETDPLTGIYNRRSLDKKMEAIFAEIEKYKHHVALIMIDLDHFKLFNDKYGHLVGDALLKQVALLLKQELKGRDFIARFGGEEFAVLLFDVDLGTGMQVAKKLCASVAQCKIKNRSGGKVIEPITISLGIALLKGDENASQFIQRADKALYTAKHEGRNQVKAALP